MFYLDNKRCGPSTVAPFFEHFSNRCIYSRPSKSQGGIYIVKSIERVLIPSSSTNSKLRVLHRSAVLSSYCVGNTCGVWPQQNTTAPTVRFSMRNRSPTMSWSSRRCHSTRFLINSIEVARTVEIRGRTKRIYTYILCLRENLNSLRWRRVRVRFVLMNPCICRCGKERQTDRANREIRPISVIVWFAGWSQFFLLDFPSTSRRSVTSDRVRFFMLSIFASKLKNPLSKTALSRRAKPFD